MPHAPAQHVRVRVVRVPAHVNGVFHHPHGQLTAWLHLKFMDGQIFEDRPDCVLIKTQDALRAMQSHKLMQTYWNTFDVGRSWRDTRLDGFFAIPRLSCRIIRTIAERRAEKGSAS